MRGKRIDFKKACWLVFAIALLVRLIVCWQLSGIHSVVSPSDVTDMETYRRLALEIRQGHWPAVFDYQPFYYTLFLPAAYVFSPKGGVWPPMLLQALVGAFTCLLATHTAARLFGRTTGIIAGLLLAVSKFHVFYTPFLLLEVWFAFWTALTLYAAVRLMQKFNWKWGMLLGAACAGALLTRGNALLWTPGLAALILWRGWKSRKQMAAVIAAAAVAFIIPIAPYSIHNSFNSNKLCGASVAGGKVLSLGNSPEAPAGGLEYPRTYYAWAEDEAAGGKTVARHILDWAKSEPLVFLEQKCRALLLFWDATEIPNNVSIDVDGKASPLLRLLLPWSILGALGLFGLLVCGWKPRASRLAALWLAMAFWGSTSAFYLLARFRVGFLPVLCVFAAAGIVELCRRIVQSKRIHTPRARNRLSVAAFALLFSIYIVDFAHDAYCQDLMPRVFRSLRPQGIALDLPWERVVYDHGPLGFGGGVPLELDNGSHTLGKSFCVKDGFLSESPVRQRLLLRVHHSRRQFAPPVVTLRSNGETLRPRASWHTERSAQWLALEFTAPVRRTEDFEIVLDERGLGVFIDLQRNYGRSTLDGEALPGEWVAELVLDR